MEEKMKKGLIVAVFLMIFLDFTLCADPWIYSADASFLVNGSTYSDNWVGGEVGTLAWKFLSNSMAEKQINPKMNNKNTLVLLFGQTYNQDIESKSWSSPLESDDKIDLESVLRFTLGWVLDPVIAGRMQSQFYDNRDPDNSRYVNPINLTESFGVARAIFKSEKQELIVRAGTGFKQSIDRGVLDSLSQKSTEISNEGGLELVTDLTTRFADDRITYKSKLSVFEALFKKDGEAVGGENYWKYPDIDWENTLSGEITKYLTVNLYLQLLYDREITEKPRYRQSLAVGLTYKLLTSP
jgi:hypothetical protein